MDIFEAVKAGDCEKILQNISQIHHANEPNGNTPLMVAAQKRLTEPIKLLLANGADINARNKEGETALHFATKEGRIDVIEMLLDNGANIDCRDTQEGYSAIFNAARAGVLPVAALLLQRGADINLPNTKVGSVPLITAACLGLDDMVLLLLQHGANVHCGTTELDNTALIWATSKCSHATVKALLDAGANPWHATKSGADHTPLTTAKDEAMKRLIREYQQVGGPCWLVRELSARGLPWATVCEAHDKLLAHDLATRELLTSVPVDLFTPAYLERIGISDLSLQEAVFHLRFQSTWLGARLTALGVGLQGLMACEALMVGKWACATEALFAQVLPEELSDAILISKGIESGVVRRCLRQVHAQVCSEQAVGTSTRTAPVPVSKEPSVIGSESDEPAACSLPHVRHVLSMLLSETTVSYALNGTLLSVLCRVLEGTEESQQLVCLHEILLHPRCGLAVVAYNEKTLPSTCRANEVNKYFLFERYVGFVQELLTVPGVLANLTSIAEENYKVFFVKGFLCTKPGYALTDNEDRAVRNTVVLVENAGVPEVNGEYHFTDVRLNAGFYSRRGLYNNKEVQFTLYKCSLKNGGFQWFLSITPDGENPGTKKDLDFYFAKAKPQDKLPAIYWLRMNPDPQRISRDPAPWMTCLRSDLGDELPVPVREQEGHNGHQGLPLPPRVDSDSSDEDANQDDQDQDEDQDSYMVVEGNVGGEDSSVSSSG